MKHVFRSLGMKISHDNTISSDTKSVRNRLLDAAEEFFSGRGFDGTSIRDLAAAADCNIASVNYYFGGKDKLYAEIWRRRMVVLAATAICRRQ